LEEVGLRIREGVGPVGEFREFWIKDPKERCISAPCFADRVLHHAVVGVCEDDFEHWLIGQTYACRKKMGMRAAIAEARRWSSSRKWYLQLDVRHYFESVPRWRMLEKLDRLFGETTLLQLWEKIIWSHRPGEDRGMPIGALTSQYLANFYLGFLDRFIKEQLRIRGYVRYMDDLVLWHNDKNVLLEARDGVSFYVEQTLGLVLKPPVLNRTSGGMDFLGFRFHTGWVGLNRRSRTRLKQRIRSYETAWAQGRITEGELQQRAAAALAFVEPALTGRMKVSGWSGEGP
jgi:RNA-directed DNA polymerase